MRFLTCLLAAAALLPELPALAQTKEAAPAPSIADQLAAKLPPDVAAAALKWTSEDSKGLKSLLVFSPAELERQVMEDLAGQPAGDSEAGRGDQGMAEEFASVHGSGTRAGAPGCPGLNPPRDGPAIFACNAGAGERF